MNENHSMDVVRLPSPILPIAMAPRGFCVLLDQPTKGFLGLYRVHGPSLFSIAENVPELLKGTLSFAGPRPSEEIYDSVDVPLRPAIKRRGALCRQSDQSQCKRISSRLHKWTVSDPELSQNAESTLCMSNIFVSQSPVVIQRS